MNPDTAIVGANGWVYRLARSASGWFYAAHPVGRPEDGYTFFCKFRLFRKTANVSAICDYMAESGIAHHDPRWTLIARRVKQPIEGPAFAVDRA